MHELVELAHAVRGGVVDNVYRGCVAVVDVDGQVRFALGDPDCRAFKGAYFANTLHRSEEESERHVVEVVERLNHGPGCLLALSRRKGIAA